MNNFAVLNTHQPYLADAGRTGIGGFKIDGSEINIGRKINQLHGWWYQKVSGLNVDFFLKKIYY